jgi:hypothetical protein
MFCLVAYFLDVPVLRLPVLSTKLRLYEAFYAFIELCGGCLGRTPLSEVIAQTTDPRFAEMLENLLAEGFVVLAGLAALVLVLLAVAGMMVWRRLRNDRPQRSS